MKTLYVTSFSETLFKASGVNMINSFIQHKIEGDLFVGYEAFNFPDIIKNQNININIKQTDIMEFDFLINWLKNNKDVIPTVFGGDMISPKEGAPKDGNKKLQVKAYQYWNKRASLWFRKIATIIYAIQHYGNDYDAIVWIDCDCVFIKQIPIRFISDILKESDVFYHQGQIRDSKDFGFETGVVGFKKGKGYDVVNEVANMYLSRQYLNLSRWDDGYVFRFVINKMIKENKIKGSDLVNNNCKGKRLDAINKGPFVNYVIHRKGIHKQLPNMNK